MCIENKNLSKQKKKNSESKNESAHASSISFHKKKKQIESIDMKSKWIRAYEIWMTRAVKNKVRYNSNIIWYYLAHIIFRICIYECIMYYWIESFRLLMRFCFSTDLQIEYFYTEKIIHEFSEIQYFTKKIRINMNF